MWIGLKEKEASGEFTPKGHIDAFYETLGRDRSGCLRGVGGVRLIGLRKVYVDQYTTATKSSVSSVNSATVDRESIKAAIRGELREEMTHNFNAILEQMGLPTFALHKRSSVIIPQPTGDPRASDNQTIPLSDPPPVP